MNTINPTRDAVRLTKDDWAIVNKVMEQLEEQHLASLTPEQRAAAIERDEIQRQQACLEQYCDGYRQGG